MSHIIWVFRVLLNLIKYKKRSWIQFRGIFILQSTHYAIFIVGWSLPFVVVDLSSYNLPTMLFLLFVLSKFSLNDHALCNSILIHMMMNITICAVTLFITRQLRVVRKKWQNRTNKNARPKLDVFLFLEVDVIPLSTFL